MSSPGDALKTVSLHWKEFWQQSHFMAVSMLMILINLWVDLLWSGQIIFWKKKKFLKIQITYPNVCQIICVLTLPSLHAVFINGHWKECWNLELEIRILYRTIQICSKFSLV